MIIETNSEKETFELGKKIGENAKAGQIYTLTGDLGVGKTVFTQGLAAGLGITEPVNSPTFTIVQMYEDGRLPFYHFDVYRIGDIEEMEEIGMLNISGQYIKVSPKFKGLMEENYLRINIGLTFNERWFMKWKVD